MKPRSLGRFLFMIGVVTLAISRTASAADVRERISAGIHSVYSELAPAFGRASG